MNKTIPNWVQKIKDMPKGRNLQRKIYQNDRTLFIRVVRPRASFPSILKRFWDFPVAQKVRIHLPMQETGVWSPVQEDPTWHGATKPQLLRLCSRAHNSQLPRPKCLQPAPCSKRSHCDKKRVHLNKEYRAQSLQLEKAGAAMKTQHNQKWIKTKVP